jgi:hypothetical protein
VAHPKKKLSPVSEGSKRPGIYFLAAIMLIAAFVYLPSLDNDILYGWDDGVYLQDDHVRDLDGEGLARFFSEFYLGMYQPLAVLSLSIDHQLFGEKPSGYHASSLLLHLLNIFLVFFFIYLLTKKISIALIVALLTAIHPMHVEAVSWIAARSTLLFTVFYLSALIFYLRYLKEEKWTKLVIAFLFFILACFTKSMAVTLPLVLFLLDHFKGRKTSQWAILEKLPFLVVSVVFGIVTIQAAGSYGHIENLSSSYTFTDRIFLLTYGIAFYLYKLILPVNLSAIYSFPLKEDGMLPVMFYLSPLFIIAIILGIFYFKKFRKEMIFGILFFLLSISLVLPFYWSRLFIVAERYSYLTYIGIYFLIGFGISGIYDRNNVKLKKIRPYFAGFLAVVIIFYLFTTLQRTKTWKDTGVLLTDVIAKPHNEATHAYAYYFRGNYRDMTMETDKALQDYNEAIGLYPEFILAYNNRGIVKGMMNDTRGALADFSRAIELKPDYADAWYNRGLAYLQLGDPERACDDWKRADSLGSPSAVRFIRKYCDQ